MISGGKDDCIYQTINSAIMHLTGSGIPPSEDTLIHEEGGKLIKKRISTTGKTEDEVGWILITTQLIQERLRPRGIKGFIFRGSSELIGLLERENFAAISSGARTEEPQEGKLTLNFPVIVYFQSRLKADLTHVWFFPDTESWSKRFRPENRIDSFDNAVGVLEIRKIKSKIREK